MHRGAPGGRHGIRDRGGMSWGQDRSGDGRRLRLSWRWLRRPARRCSAGLPSAAAVALRFPFVSCRPAVRSAGYERSGCLGPPSRRPAPSPTLWLTAPLAPHLSAQWASCSRSGRRNPGRNPPEGSGPRRVALLPLAARRPQEQANQIWLRLPWILSPQHPATACRVSIAGHQRTEMQQKQRIAGEERGRPSGGRWRRRGGQARAAV